MHQTRRNVPESSNLYIHTMAKQLKTPKQSAQPSSRTNTPEYTVYPTQSSAGGLKVGCYSTPLTMCSGTRVCSVISSINSASLKSSTWTCPNTIQLQGTGCTHDNLRHRHGPLAAPLPRTIPGRGDTLSGRRARVYITS